MNKNIHSDEIHRLADAPQGTKIWYRAKLNGTWVLSNNYNWQEGCFYIINDEWAEIRKAMIDSKVIEISNKKIWSNSLNSVTDMGLDGISIKDYRIKPDVVEPVYYQYERLYQREIKTVVLTEQEALISACTEDNGWFKIESSKREWGH